MATCKECLYVEACKAIVTIINEATELQIDDDIETTIDADFTCEYFADRSRFVELPCKVGDTVYWDILGKPVEDEITNITIYDNCTRVFLKKGISFDIEDIGRMIFLSREQAEQALKEREKNGKC